MTASPTPFETEARAIDEARRADATPEPECAGIVAIDWPASRGRATMPIVFAELTVRDAQTGEVLVGIVDLKLRAKPNSVTVELTEIVGESGRPIRQYNQREKAAETPDGEGLQTVTRMFLVAPRVLGGDDA